MTPKIQAGWRIDAKLKRWVDVQAARRGIRPGHIIEALIRKAKRNGK